MARVLIATQAWGVVQDRSGNVSAGTTVTIKNTDGTAATHWSAQTGGSSSTADQVTDSNGGIQRWIEESQYDVTVGGVTQRVQAMGAGPFVRVPKPSGGADDTAMMQAAHDLAGPGGSVQYASGIYPFTTLTYYSNQTIRGTGQRRTELAQISGTASPMLQPSDPTAAYKYVLIEDLYLNASSNTSNTGGLLLDGVQHSDIARVQVGGTKNYAFRVIGHGTATSGDAMFNRFTNCYATNMQSGYGWQLSPASGGGSHPDSTRLIACDVNSAIGTAYRIDAASSDSVGFFAAGDCCFFGCTAQQVPIVFDIQGGQGHKIISGRFERTGNPGDTMTVTIASPNPTNNPTRHIVFAYNTWATHAVLADFVWTDTTTNGVTRLFEQVAGAGAPISQLPQQASSEVTNNSSFVDSADALPKFKTNAGKVLSVGGMTKLFDSTLGSSATTIDATSIPAGFSSLLIIARLRSDRAAAVDTVKINLNNDTGANYDYEYTGWSAGVAAGASTTAVGAATALAGRCPANTAPANAFNALRFEIPFYDDTTNHKTAVGSFHWKEGTGAQQVGTGTFGLTYKSTSAVSRITIAANTGPNFVAGSRLMIFGLL